MNRSTFVKPDSIFPLSSKFREPGEALGSIPLLICVADVLYGIAASIRDEEMSPMLSSIKEFLDARPLPTFGVSQLFGDAAVIKRFEDISRQSIAASKLAAALNSAKHQGITLHWLDARRQLHATIQPKCEDELIPALIELSENFAVCVRHLLNDDLLLSATSAWPTSRWHLLPSETKRLVGFRIGELQRFFADAGISCKPLEQSPKVDAGSPTFSRIIRTPMSANDIQDWIFSSALREAREQGLEPEECKKYVIQAITEALVKDLERETPFPVVKVASKADGKGQHLMLLKGNVFTQFDPNTLALFVSRRLAAPTDAT